MKSFARPFLSMCCKTYLYRSTRVDKMVVSLLETSNKIRLLTIIVSLFTDVAGKRSKEIVEIKIQSPGTLRMNVVLAIVYTKIIMYAASKGKTFT